MKTTILHLLSLFVILSVAGSCGKKDESKSGSALPPIQNTSSVLPISVGAQSLNDWYNSTTLIGTFPIPTITNRYPNLDRFEEVRMKRTYTNTCETKPVKLIFGLELEWEYCNQKTPKAEPLSKTTIQALTSVSKASFPRLAAVMNGSLGQISKVYKPEYEGSTSYTIDILKPNGSYIYVTIDTNIHPAFNPVSTFDSETKVEEFLSDIKVPF